MRYAIAFTLIGVCLIFLGSTSGGWALLLVWPGISFAAVGFAYGFLGVKVFGKRQDGGIAWSNFILLLPFLLFTWIVWRAQYLFNSEPESHEVAPSLLLGRRPNYDALPKDVSLIVDLTAEFPVAVRSIAGRNYCCLPTLDSCAPDEDPFVATIERITGHQGAVYIHCANGHGRSATVAAAVLIARGLASDPADAVKKLQAVRPGVKLKPAQLRLLNRLAQRLAVVN